MDKCTHEVRLQYWKNIIQQCQARPNGQSAKQWMAENGICEQSYYLWQRRIRKEAYEEMNTAKENLPAVQGRSEIDFAEIAMPTPKQHSTIVSDVFPNPVAMSNWVVWSAERYFRPVYDLMINTQLQAHVNQCDETLVEVIHDDRPAGSKSYMWVHLTGDLSPDPKIIVYEYQKTRHSDHPKEYYKEFKGILMTDGLEQYHKLAREQERLVKANCLAHARRHFANAIKAMGSGNAEAVKASVAYKALVRIGAIYDLEGTLKGLTPKERLKERQSSIKPLVEEYFAWIKEVFRQRLVLAKSETAKGLAYSINQEEYLKVFLTDGEVPIDKGAVRHKRRLPLA